ncbi:MAG: chemotaxis protein CheW [Acidobacteria bacterium]|nr:chemotaxis protein CheW [Acidobacteriota bacterium]
MTDSAERFLHFLTSSHSFLVPLPQLYRIISHTPPKPVPFSPDYIQGVIHFEGNLWVVVDLDAILGAPADDVLPELILARHDECHLAFRARRTRDIVTVPEDRREIRAVPGLPAPCVSFVTVLGGNLTYGLNLGEFVEALSAK